MLILTRREGESLIIGHDIKVTIFKIGNEFSDYSVRIGIEAPDDVEVNRQEIYDRKYPHLIEDKGNKK